LHQGSFEDSRAEIHYDDAEAQLKSSQGNFDVIVIDLPEPLEQGPAYHLYTKEFYQFLRGKLSPQGVLCLQAGYSTWGNHLMFTAICHTLKAVFPLVFPYQTHIPSFGGIWGFALASQKFSPLQLPSADIDRTISSRLKGSLRFYDGATHHGMFLLPRHLRAEIEGEKRVISDKDPLFVFQP
jgi:spermidine synthase